MRVLYLNHTAQMSGAEHSLMDLLAGLPAHVEPVLACPEGDLAAAARELGVTVRLLAGTTGSLRMHPVHTSRAVAALASDGLRVRRLARSYAIDVIHANSVRAGIIAAMAGTGSVPLLVHVRDCLPPSMTANGVRQLLSRRATMIVGNSRYTTANFVGDRLVQHETVYNPVDLRRFDPQRYASGAARDHLGISRDALVAAVIAQLSPWKGHVDVIRAWKGVVSAHPDAQLLIVGEAKFAARATRYDNASYEERLRSLIEELELTRHVRFLGQRRDIPEILAATDLLLAPSWEEPFGRTIIEAMAMSVPAVATNTGGPAEIIDDGVDGILLPPRRPDAWAQAISSLGSHSQTRRAFAERAHAKVAAQFSREKHVRHLVDLYDRLLADREDDRGAAAIPSANRDYA